MILSDSLVLLAKQPGLTSFSSLWNVKKAMQTTKVGHTGTLDSFAQGLLVVCTGKLTKLCGQITSFDKTYEAVIHFGKETDTLEYTGKFIRTASLPSEEALMNSLNKWTGKIMQKPPVFSAIHVDGKRASDLARNGNDFEIPSRPVTVFSSKILDLKKDESGFVEFAHIEFSVSKGTYIRSLARDIAEAAGSAAYLTGLYRTKVGNFNIKEAAGFSCLKEFNIDSAYEEEKKYLNQHFDLVSDSVSKPKGKKEISEADLLLQKEILETAKSLSAETAVLCGFETVFLKNEESLEAFKNGKKLQSSMFIKSLWDFPKNTSIAVFFNRADSTENSLHEEKFCGLINKNEEGKISYSFVIN